MNYNLENLPNEIWVPVYGYEDLYLVSNYGRIKSKKRNIIRKVGESKGYYNIVLCKNGKTRTKMVQRVVLESFMPCDNMDKLQVNHKDENKHNNCLDNLEWLTPKENVNYGTGIAKRAHTQQLNNSRSKPVQCIETGETFISVRECARKLDLDLASLSRVLTGKQHTTKNLHFKYLEK